MEEKQALLYTVELDFDRTDVIKNKFMSVSCKYFYDFL